MGLGIKKLKKTIFEEKISDWQTRYSRVSRIVLHSHSFQILKKRLVMKNFNTDFFLTQFLTRHWSFADYLKRFGKVESDLCRDCRIETDGVVYKIFKCVCLSSEKNRWGLPQVIDEVDITSMDGCKFSAFKNLLEKAMKGKVSITPASRSSLS